MGEKLVLGIPISKGLKTDRTPFNIDNDSFPTLINAYQWRGRVKRKRGTGKLCRLTRFFKSTISSYGSILTIPVDANGVANLLSEFSLESGGNIVPGSVTFTGSVGGVVFTDPTKDGFLTPTGTSGPNTINYSTGVVTIPSQANGTLSVVSFLYTPDLVSLGLPDLTLPSTQYPQKLAFDTTYAYQIQTTEPYGSYDVSFYKNPPADASLPGYVAKTTPTLTRWNGQDYQQYWGVNYQNAFWVTNGVTVPFTTTNIGMQFKPILTVTVTTGGPPAIVNLQITGHGLIRGDFVFINEVLTTTGINFETGYVIAVIDANNVTVEFPTAVIATNGTGGIAQYLTSQAIPTKDCIRWYDGDPTNGNAILPQLTGNEGWVNFMPPLSQSNYSISELPPLQYYLVGARTILPYKDRLLFFGAVIQASTGVPIYLPDTVVYSQNGTPYYTASFIGTNPAAVTNPTTAYFSMLVPVNQTGVPNAFFEDSAGFGGFATSGLNQQILSTAPNEDVIIVGLDRQQSRFVYTGNDISPFEFYTVNSELGTGSTFSTVVLDQGVVTRGPRGYLITSQTNSKRFDLEIPDQVFQINLSNNGAERFTAARDFINEWIYFTYPVNGSSYKFPTQTLQYNYRDESWGVFNESFTCYGQFKKLSGFTWATVGNTYSSWLDWDQPWNATQNNPLQPLVIGGNQQGFIVTRDSGTSETPTLTIISISTAVTITNITQAAQGVVTANNTFAIGQSIMIMGVLGMTQINNKTVVITAVTPTSFTISLNTTGGSGFSPYISGGIGIPIEPIYSPNHCLSNGDYIMISGALGTIGTQVNGKIFSVQNPTVNGFMLNPSITLGGTYFGGGLITKMYVPFIQTKQFPTAWSIGRKTRIGVQQYLFTKTTQAQIQLLIYLSQDNINAYNDVSEIPNDAIIYSTILYTCPESTNLGLLPTSLNMADPFLTNLQQLSEPQTVPSGTVGNAQAQIWHRMNTSLIGDTVQFGFTMSDSQMRTLDVNNLPISQFAEIEFHGAILDINPSQLLS
jgi:hypothetical protein